MIVNSIGLKHLINQPDYFFVLWNFNKFCNYDCSYCWPSVHSRESKFEHISSYLAIVDDIKVSTKLKGFNKIHFLIQGGEITAYKHIDKVIAAMAGNQTDQQVDLTITTNLSPSLSYWTNFLKHTRKFSNFTLAASYHNQFANFDDFLNKSIYLSNNMDKYFVLLMATPDNCQHILDCRKILNDNKVVNKVMLVRDWSGKLLNFPQNVIDQATDNDQLEIFVVESDTGVFEIDMTSKIRLNDIRHFKGFKCGAGRRTISINNDGSIVRCFSDTNTVLGHINTGFTLFDKDLACGVDDCNCSMEIGIPKTR